jgi:hypothetical protein
MKKIGNSLCPLLAKLINNCLCSGIYPNSLKISIVSPMYKSGSKIEMSNYRPVAILPIISKIFDYVILRRLEEHMHINKILSPNQFGYTKHSNTEIAVAHTLNDVYGGIDQNLYTTLTCLDLSRAFDCVKLSILLDKLKKLKFSSNFFLLLQAYFSNRKQIVKVNDEFSSILDVRHGVPQGGVLSGLLFNFYVNSINQLELNSSLFLYCDDISLVTCDNDITGLKAKIANDLKKISTWLSFHYLFPNEKKTKYILFRHKRSVESLNLPLNISFNNTIIERVTHLRFLGLVIDEVLKFSFHINSIHARLTSFVFALKRIRRYISLDTAKALYYAFVQSRLSFMNVIWCCAPGYLIESLELLQRKSLRIIFEKDYCCSRLELYSNKFLSVSNLAQYSSLLLVFKMHNHLAKVNVTLQYANQVHRYNTRNNDNFTFSRLNTRLGSLNFFVRAFTLYNNLPNEIRRQLSIGLFKSMVRDLLHDEFILRYRSVN